VGYEVFKSAEQKGTKASLIGIGAGIGTRLDQMREKALCQILRVVGIGALASKKQKDWSPINPA
jgi:hypothetical protein